MSKMNKEIELITEFEEDWTKCAMKYGKEIEEITQEEWRDFIQSEIDEKSEQRRKEGMTNPKKPHIKYLWDEERMQWYTDMKAYKNTTTRRKSKNRRNANSVIEFSRTNTRWRVIKRKRSDA